MKKPILLLLALSAGLSLACAASSALDGSILGSAAAAPPAQERPAGQNSASDGASPQALCRQVEVPLDEGYGVSSREKRIVCQESP